MHHADKHLTQLLWLDPETTSQVVVSAVVVVTKNCVGNDDKFGGVEGAHNHTCKFHCFAWNLGHDLSGDYPVMSELERSERIDGIEGKALRCVREVNSRVEMQHTSANEARWMPG